MIWRWLVNSLAVAAATWLVAGISVTAADTTGVVITVALVALVLGAVIATFYFFFFPTELPRRELADVHAGPVTQAAWAFLLSADNPTNSFPSMHVALSGITAIGLMRSHPHWGWLAPVWTAAR